MRIRRAPKLPKLPRLHRLSLTGVVGALVNLVWELAWIVAQLAAKAVVVTVTVLVAATVWTGGVAWRHGRPQLARAARWTAAKVRARQGQSQPTTQQTTGDGHSTQPAQRMRGPGSSVVRASHRDRSSSLRVATTVAGAHRVRALSASAVLMGGVRMAEAMPKEFQQVLRAASPLGELDPATAWELDEQLASFARMWPVMAAIFSNYAENLDRNVRIDPRIVAAFMAAVGQMNDLYKAFADTRMQYRLLYAKAFEQAESSVRTPDRAGFWNRNAA